MQVPQAPRLGRLMVRNELNATGVVNAAEVWVAGRYTGTTSVATGDLIEIMRWDGSSWQRVPPPFVPSGAGAWIDDVVVAGPRDAWFFGFDLGGPGTTESAASYHWNGSQLLDTRCTALLQSGRVPGVEAFRGSATSPNDVWMCGDHLGASSYSRERYLCHWDGSRWTHTGAVEVQGARLAAIEAVAPADVWAAGSSQSAPYYLMMHWDGRTWTTSTTGSLPLAIPPQLSLIGRRIYVQGADVGTASGCAGFPLTLTDTLVLEIG